MHFRDLSGDDTCFVRSKAERTREIYEVEKEKNHRTRP